MINNKSGIKKFRFKLNNLIKPSLNINHFKKNIFKN